MKRQWLMWLCAALCICLLTPSAGAQTDEVQWEEYSFAVGSDEEASHLVNGAALNSIGIRFADRAAEIVYCFELQNKYQIQQVEFSASLFQQLLLLVSTDGVRYHEVYRWDGDPGPQKNQGLVSELRTFDLTEYVAVERLDSVWVKIADAYPDAGWGGALHPSEAVTLSVRYLPSTPEQVAMWEHQAMVATLRPIMDRMSLLSDDALSHMDEQSFKQIARATVALRQEYAALEDEHRSFLDEYGLPGRIAAAETAIAAYEQTIKAQTPVADDGIELPPESEEDIIPMAPPSVSEEPKTPTEQTPTTDPNPDVEPDIAPEPEARSGGWWLLPVGVGALVIVLIVVLCIQRKRKSQKNS